MELLIDKKYLIRLEKYTKFGYCGSFELSARYVFSLPENAGIPQGYTIYIEAKEVTWDTEYLSFNSNPLYTKELENNKTYRLNRDDTEFIATMTENREQGKRYKRYKFSAEELYALYQNVDLTSAQYAVAKIDIYFKGNEGVRHKILFGNFIDKTVYLVGKVQGCWFYCSELDTKRRINSHGVTILGNIENTAVKNVEELIQDTYKKFIHHKSVYNEVYGARNVLNRVIDNLRYFCDEEYIKEENVDILKKVRSVQTNAKDTLEFIKKRLAEQDTEERNIFNELENEMSKFYINERINKNTTTNSVQQAQKE